MNILVLEGRTTKDFVKKNDMAYSTIAINRYKSSSMFVDISCFGKVADYCAEHIKKGTKVIVEGELNIYESNGKKYVSCSVKSIANCGKREQADDEQPINEKSSGQVEDVVSVDDDDMLPF